MNTTPQIVCIDGNEMDIAFLMVNGHVVAEEDRNDREYHNQYCSVKDIATSLARALQCPLSEVTVTHQEAEAEALNANYDQDDWAWTDVINIGLRKAACACQEKPSVH